jgi:hypothetical protein
LAGVARLGPAAEREPGRRPAGQVGGHLERALWLGSGELELGDADVAVQPPDHQRQHRDPDLVGDPRHGLVRVRAFATDDLMVDRAVVRGDPDPGGRPADADVVHQLEIERVHHPGRVEFDFEPLPDRPAERRRMPRRARIPVDRGERLVAGVRTAERVGEGRGGGRGDRADPAVGGHGLVLFTGEREHVERRAVLSRLLGGGQGLAEVVAHPAHVALGPPQAVGDQPAGSARRATVTGEHGRGARRELPGVHQWQQRFRAAADRRDVLDRCRRHPRNGALHLEDLQGPEARDLGDAR